MIVDHVTRHDYSLDVVRAEARGEGEDRYARIVRSVAFGLDHHAIVTAIDLTPAQATYLRDALVALFPYPAAAQS